MAARLNDRNELQCFDRTNYNHFRTSEVGLAAHEGDEETLKSLLASGKRISPI